MSTSGTAERRLRCIECGHTAPVGDGWSRIEARGIGTLTECPDCGSTNVEHQP